MIRALRSKDYINFIDHCLKFDKYGDFYLFENHRRIFLNNGKNASRLYRQILKHGDKCFVHFEREIDGIGLITGYKDKTPFKYLKVFSYNKKVIRNIFKYVNMNYIPELFLRVKKHNPVYTIALENHFHVVKDLGKEILLKRERKHGSK